jgi:lipopolysaccharide/colanic/teichoic acid biosynthesis glycosyltransferase
MKKNALLISIDFLLLAIAFVLVHAINYGHARISPTSWDVFQLQAAVVLGLSLLMGKYRRALSLDLRRAAAMVLKVVMICLLLLSLIIVGMQWMHLPRAMTYGTVLALAGLELAVVAAFRRRATPDTGHAQAATTRAGRRERSVYAPLMVIDAILLAASVALAIYLKRGRLSLEPPYDHILYFTAGLWWVSAMVTGKFDKNNFNDLLTAIGPALRSAALMAAGLALLIYFFRVGAISRFQTFAPLLFLLAMEFAVFKLYVNYRKGGRPNGDISDPSQVREMIATQDQRRPLAQEKSCPVTDPVAEKLQHALDFFDARIFEMLSAKVPLETIDRCDCALLSTDSMFNLEALDAGRMRLIINLHKLNDIRWFNRYFLTCHNKLAPGGYIMGKAHTVATHRAYFRKKYPRTLGTLFYAASFLWNRVFPKLPWLQKIYFAVTRGRNRIVSQAEILGRLCFCGFRIVDEAVFGHRFYFIAQKSRTPSDNRHPSYGPLVNLRRSGLGGRPLKVYKFRTMYPYSEFLQEYVYAHNALAEGGKFKNDFRVTGWGAFLRRTWIDELPMLYNWLRGDLQLVGVRPLSDQYQQLYDADLRALRQKFKPGLLPPFYADLPKTLEEIQDSERRYLEAYLKRPLRTQIVYLFKGVWNIAVKKRRSA